MTCPDCEKARANARAAGHRDWKTGVCYDHAGVRWEALMARHSPAERAIIERLADGIEAAGRAALEGGE